jgi:hypothetical protein
MIGMCACCNCDPAFCVGSTLPLHAKLSLGTNVRIFDQYAVPLAPSIVNFVDGTVVEMTLQRTPNVLDNQAFGTQTFDALWGGAAQCQTYWGSVGVGGVTYYLFIANGQAGRGEGPAVWWARILTNNGAGHPPTQSVYFDKVYGYKIAGGITHQAQIIWWMPGERYSFGYVGSCNPLSVSAAFGSIVGIVQYNDDKALIHDP